MKTPIFFLLGFTILVLATVVVGVPVFTKIYGPDMFLDPLTPVKGLPLGTREYPLPERSVVAIKLELPVSALRENAQTGIPKEFKGVNRENFHKKITEGVTNWRIQPAPLRLQNTGRGLAFQLPFKGEAYSTGRYGILKIRVRGNAHWSGAVSGNFTPTITRAWQVNIPDLNPALSIGHAQINMGRRGSQDGRAEVRAALEPVIRKETNGIGPSLTEALHLKAGVTKLWNQAHVIRQLSGDPVTWVVFDPCQVEMSPIDYSNPASLSITVGLVAQSFLSNTAPINRTPDPLPNIEFRGDRPTTDIRIPIIVNFNALNSYLASRSFAVKPKIGPSFVISNLEVEPGGQPRFLDLVMKVNLPEAELGKAMTGKVRVHGKPIVDCLTQTMGFSDVSMSVDSEETLTGSLAWLLDEMVVQTIERELRLDLKEYLPEMENEIHKVISSAPVPENLELHFDRPEVKLIGAYTVDRKGWNAKPSPGIVFVMGATGKIDVKMRRL